MRAIDLFSGIGGWTLGLESAGIEVVNSYEIWSTAIDIYNRNHSAKAYQVDIGELKKEDLPEGIDIVVGSPPCTNFSWSNRGGSGDLDAGVAGLCAFFEVVLMCNPKYWIFENVPRVQEVINNATKHPNLKKYADLIDQADFRIVDMQEFGLPQRRKRLLLGNIDFSILDKAKGVLPAPSLGDVLQAVKSGKDLIFDRCRITDSTEDKDRLVLSKEEVRYNWELKKNHVVYNDMCFPDLLNKPARTITATCTAVSRESIVISEDDGISYRRLSTRERAGIQSFPIDFDFGPHSEGTRFKVLGNAMPPLMAYACAQAILGRNIELPTKLKRKQPPKTTRTAIVSNTGQRPLGPVTANPNRSFRFAIGGLRFKSGMRFELINTPNRELWRVQFVYGPPGKHAEFSVSSLGELKLDRLNHGVGEHLTRHIERCMERSAPVYSSDLQEYWSQRGDTGWQAFKYIDFLSGLANDMQLVEDLARYSTEELGGVAARLLFDVHQKPLMNKAKIARFGADIIRGFTPMVAHNSGIFDRSFSMAAE